jgi:hypothetical protein
MRKVENIGYYKNKLIRLFEEYNECYDQEYVNFAEKQKKDLFNLSIRPGFNNSSLSMESIITTSTDIDFGNELNFRFGIEAEFILPFNNNKWAIIIEPTYQYFKSEKELKYKNIRDEIVTYEVGKVEYTSIEVPFGVRHYFFLNDNSKIFINGSVVLDFSRNSDINFKYARDLEIGTESILAFGLGYKYNDKFGIELRYHTSRNILSNYSNWYSNYDTVSAIFGFSFF